MDDTIRVGDPVDLDLGFTGGWVYRLWGPGDLCLYVGQTRALHPWKRIGDHRRKGWWGLVLRCDYIQVYDVGYLDDFEESQIDELKPAFNVQLAEPTRAGERVRNVFTTVMNFYGFSVDDVFGKRSGDGPSSED